MKSEERIRKKLNYLRNQRVKTKSTVILSIIIGRMEMLQWVLDDHDDERNLLNSKE